MTTPNQVSHADHRRLATLAQTLADRRSASNSYVNVKVSAQGVPQPDVNVTPDTTEEDLDRMTDLAIKAVSRIMDATNGAEKTATAKAARQAGAIAARKAKS